MKHTNTPWFVCPHCGTEYWDRRDLSDSGKYCATCILEVFDSYAAEKEFVAAAQKEADVVACGLSAMDYPARLKDEDARRTYKAVEAVDPDLLREWIEDYVIGAGAGEYRGWLIDTR